MGAFAIGTTELVIVGVLGLMADDMRVSIGTAGLLVTAYALGISFGGPIATALTLRLGRRLLLRLALVAFIAGNLIAVAATAFGVLLAARAITGALHGLFLGAASAVATGLVPAERRGHAVSLVFGGIAVSTVLGVPLGTLVGQTLGWRATFTGVAILCAVALAATFLFVPNAAGSGSGGLAAQARHAFAPRVLAMLGAGVLLMAAQFTALTYLTPLLEDVTGIPGGAVSAFLLIFGVTSAIGTFAGGRFADRNASGTLLVGNGVLVLALGGLYLSGPHPLFVAVALAAWGLVGMGITPSLQLRVISLAGEGGDLAATLGASAVNAGIASGAAIGGGTVAAYGLEHVPLAAVVVSAVALPATWATRWLRVPATVVGSGETAPGNVVTNTGG
ncbi:MFS transporter [Streptomyces sp. NRRL S-1813]|uniref:MFS transporter n=1 Tax=Streptomyces sp. NRRL S-1813 TaxID=1463888 RepID=UPI0022785CC8|nr:MFS transporter [Streptomyces sp. NRRL S-1813]